MAMGSLKEAIALAPRRPCPLLSEDPSFYKRSSEAVAVAQPADGRCPPTANCRWRSGTVASKDARRPTMGTRTQTTSNDTSHNVLLGDGSWSRTAFGGDWID